MEDKNKIPYDPNGGVDKHFVIDKDGKLFEEDVKVQLPNVEEDVKSQKLKVKSKYDLIKRITINLGKFKIGVNTMNILKLIGAVIALVIAFLFVFVFPGAGFEALVIGVIASILNSFGITSWRLDYGIIKEWYQSKTIWGSLMVVIPIICILVIKLTLLTVSPWIVTILYALIAAGGGTQLLGIWLAISNAKETEKFIK